MRLSSLASTLRQAARQAVTGNKGNMLPEGTPAPDFEISDESGNRHNLNQYRGKKVVLWFFPRAMTPG